MGTIRKRGKSYRAWVKRSGKRESCTFASKAEAQAWVIRTEGEILDRKRGIVPPHTVQEALEKYGKEVSPSHKGKRWELVRLKKLARELPFRGRLLADVTSADINEWRHGTNLAQSSIRREMVLVRSVFESCRRDWGWATVNPFDGISWPKGNNRTRTATDEEVENLVRVFGWEPYQPAGLALHRLSVMILFALETGMRSGEIIGLTAESIDREGRAARLPRTKNGDQRLVPLSRTALLLLDCLPETKGNLFGMSHQTRDEYFRRAKKKAGISGLTFHDLRRTAITALSKKLDVLDLARMVGHRDVKSLLIYYSPTPKSIAERLD